MQLLKCRADDVQGLNFWICEGRYLSYDIVNELLEIIAHKILRDLLHNIREWFAIIADETRDCSGVEQFSISLHWAATDYVISEDEIDFASVEHTDAATLTTTLGDVLIRSNLPLIQCRGQAYDRAPNMSGV